MAARQLLEYIVLKIDDKFDSWVCCTQIDDKVRLPSPGVLGYIVIKIDDNDQTRFDSQ